MKKSLRTYSSRLLGLIKSPPFISLTIAGNGLIVLCSFVFYLIESPLNPKVAHFIDALWWAFATVTTVGYGDVVPQSVFGKLLGIGLMLMGTGLFATYTALFANAMLGREFSRLDKKVKIIDKSVAGMQYEMSHEELHLEKSLSQLGKRLKEIEEKIDKLK